MNKMPPFTAYLAPAGFEHELERELDGTIIEAYDRLYLAEGKPRDVLWADNIWRNPQFIEIDSIGDAATKLKAIQRNWAHLPLGHHRRSQLIAEKLPHVSAKPIKFPSTPPKAPLGSWTLLEPNLLLAASDCSSPYPNGAWLFEENKTDAPSRAYLKLWEALMRAGKMPQPGETCLDLGSCPGGWTWVLQTLGANVISVDKAPLADNIAALPNIKYVQQSAFALKPEEIGKVDWLFSDIICYPERLLRLVEAWKKSGLVRNMICTIKFQGETEMDQVRKFLEFDGSSIVHLYNNKHEITWIYLT